MHVTLSYQGEDEYRDAGQKTTAFVSCAATKRLGGKLKFGKCIDVMIVLYFHKEGHKPLGPVLDGLVGILKKEAVKKRDLDDNNLVSRSPWWWSRDTLSSWISSFW